MTAFNDPTFAWELLQWEIAIEMNESLSGKVIAKLLALYMVRTPSFREEFKKWTPYWMLDSHILKTSSPHSWWRGMLWRAWANRHRWPKRKNLLRLLQKRRKRNWHRNYRKYKDKCSLPYWLRSDTRLLWFYCKKRERLRCDWLIRLSRTIGKTLVSCTMNIR